MLFVKNFVVCGILIVFANLLFNGCASIQKYSINQTKEATDPSIIKYDALFPVEANSVYVLHTDFDLQGKTYVIPKNVTIVSKNHVIRNGTLVGNGTKIKTDKAIFDNVCIIGNWNVKNISTSLFKDLSYKNALRDVMALTNPRVKNNVIIEEGLYMFDAEKSGAKYICVNSNTNVVINGTIEIMPNKFKTYYIVSVEGDNIKVSGKGSIIGDKHNHLSREGEWGMGIYISNSTKCDVSDLTVKDCWGDCIYVGRNSKDIQLSDLLLENGRRQGISITGGENIKIVNTIISGVSGTAPAYAIDIEPNKHNHICNVTIDNVVVRNCEGGFVVSVIYPNLSSVDRVCFNRCKVEEVKKKYTLSLKNCKNVVVNKSYLCACPFSNNCNFANVVGVLLKDNIIHTKDVVVNGIANVSLIGNSIYGNGLYTETKKNTLTSKYKIRNNKTHK